MKKGFTLVELLVVISILAILGTIGTSYFINAQRNTRDTKRILDLTNIAKSLEISKNFNTRIYYNKLSTDFVKMPTDPLSPTKEYCIKVATTEQNILSPTRAEWINGCPDGWVKVANDIDFTGVKSWNICSYQENSTSNGGTGIFCVHSLEK